jgi:hypothetical protein
MFLLKIVLVVVLALVIEKQTTRTIFLFSRGVAEGARASLWVNGKPQPSLLARRAHKV